MQSIVTLLWSWVQATKAKLITLHNLVQPHVAGILNIGTAHLGEFGGREGICRAKSEIYAHILHRQEYQPLCR